MLRFRQMLSMMVLAIFLGPLSGCGFGANDIQFEGKVFDMIGLNNTGQREEPRVKDRAPILMPPENKLPEPGKRIVQKEDMQWPDDPDVRAARERQMAEAEIKKYCAGPGMNEHHPDYDAAKAGKCSILNKAFQKTFQRVDDNSNSN